MQGLGNNNKKGNNRRKTETYPGKSRSSRPVRGIFSIRCICKMRPSNLLYIKRSHVRAINEVAGSHGEVIWEGYDLATLQHRDLGVAGSQGRGVMVFHKFEVLRLSDLVLPTLYLTFLCAQGAPKNFEVRFFGGCCRGYNTAVEVLLCLLQVMVLWCYIVLLVCVWVVLLCPPSYTCKAQTNIQTKYLHYLANHMSEKYSKFKCKYVQHLWTKPNQTYIQNT